MVWGYHAAEPNSYLVITGAGVKGLKLTKKAMVYPFQKVSKISITPFHFTTDLQAMTSEKLQVCLPAVFTIGPKDEQESLIKYAGLMTDSTSDAGVASREHIQAIIMGIVEGETRSVVSNITMKELFEKRSLYRTKVVEHVQTELTQFGLHIYNASIKELRDMPGSHYFEFQSRKAHEGAQQSAKVCQNQGTNTTFSAGTVCGSLRHRPGRCLAEWITHVQQERGVIAFQSSQLTLTVRSI